LADVVIQPNSPGELSLGLACCSVMLAGLSTTSSAVDSQAPASASATNLPNFRAH